MSERPSASAESWAASLSPAQREAELRYLRYTQWRPTEFVAAHHHLVRCLRGETGVDWSQHDAQRDANGKDNPDAATAARRLGVAELYVIDEAMSELAITAGASLTDYRLHRDDLPARHGMAHWHVPVFHRRPGEVPTLALSWSVVGDGVALNWWRDGRAHVHFHFPPEEQISGLAQWGPLVDYYTGYLPFDTAQELLLQNQGQYDWRDGEEEAVRSGINTLLATWLLMGQTITLSTPHETNRAERRQLARTSTPLREVRIVTLRRPVMQPKETDVGTPGRASPTGHWRGDFWRNQWHPSQNRHVPTYIPLHLVNVREGDPVPDLKDRVNVLRR